MKMIGLTGGIASGKSTVSHWLRGQGARIIDADAIAYDLSRPNQPIWNGFVEHYGTKILQPDQSLNRAEIGKIVFASCEERQWVDRMSHPLIRKEMRQQLEQYRKQGARVVFLDIPLLFESGWDKLLDTVWVVYVDPPTQLKRLMARNQLSTVLAEQRIASQMSLDEKKNRADFVIDNNGTREYTIQQLEQIWEDLQTIQEE